MDDVALAIASLVELLFRALGPTVAQPIVHALAKLAGKAVVQQHLDEFDLVKAAADAQVEDIAGPRP